MSRTFLAKWRNAVRDAECLDSSAKLILLMLSTYMDASGLAWPAKTTLAGKARISARTVDRAISAAELAGFLNVTHATGYKRAGNKYRATIPNSVTGTDLNASWTTPNSVTDDAQYRRGDARKHLESKRKRTTTGTVTAEVSKAQNCGVAKTPFEAAERWFEATGQQMVEEDALEMLTHHYGLSELESRRLLRQAKAEVA